MTDSELTFNFGRTDQARALVCAFHYSHRFPANVQAVGTLHRDGGLFGGDGEAVAACVFTIPPTRWAEPLLELARLVRNESVRPQLSSLIAQTCNQIKRRKLANLLVSFADWTQGHHGGIYQAASWNYAGKRNRVMDGLLVDGQFVPGRSCNSAWGTRSPSKLAEILPNKRIEPHYDEGKHLYWRALTRIGRLQASRLGLDNLPYPKPTLDKGAL